MKILLVGKRLPQQRDLVERPYGRFYYLPTLLKRMGHDVGVLLCSHHGLASVETERDGVTWWSRDLRLSGARRLMHEFDEKATAFGPDWIVGVSDAQYGWLAHRLAKRTGARLAIDAYDNYEAYMPWNFPLHVAWRRAVRAADLVTAAGPQLAQRLQGHRPTGYPVQVLPMAADPAFFPMDRLECRARLNLPVDAPLIGYSGAWARNRGTHVLLDAFRRVQAAQPHARLVLSGRPPTDVCAEPGVIALGYLDDAQLPVLLNALDVACVITADTAFGRYSYPAKLCEAMACGIPVVATATDPVRWMLGRQTQCLAAVDNAGDIAAHLLENLASDRIDYGRSLSWSDLAERFANLLSVSNGSMLNV